MVEYKFKFIDWIIPKTILIINALQSGEIILYLL